MFVWLIVENVENMFFGGWFFFSFFYSETFPPSVHIRA